MSPFHDLFNYPPIKRFVVLESIPTCPLFSTGRATDSKQSNILNVNWIILAQVRVQLRDLVNTIMKVRVS
jgi:hypothetical protein